MIGLDPKPSPSALLAFKLGFILFVVVACPLLITIFSGYPEWDARLVLIWLSSVFLGVFVGIFTIVTGLTEMIKENDYTINNGTTKFSALGILLVIGTVAIVLLSYLFFRQPRFA